MTTDRHTLPSLGVRSDAILEAVRAATDGGRRPATTGDVEHAYRALCQATGERAVGHTQLWAYLHALAAAGQVSMLRRGKGYRGCTSVIHLLHPAQEPGSVVA